MKYLLSNGRLTEDVKKYIRDLIYVNMLLLPGEIPYFNGGSEELIQDIKEVNIKPNIELIVNKVIERISNAFPTIMIRLLDITLNQASVRVRIEIDNLIEIYEIKGFNKK